MSGSSTTSIRLLARQDEPTLPPPMIPSAATCHRVLGPQHDLSCSAERDILRNIGRGNDIDGCDSYKTGDGMQSNDDMIETVVRINVVAVGSDIGHEFCWYRL